MSLDTAFRKDKPLLLAPPAAESDLPAVYRDSCIQNQTEAAVIACRYGAVEGTSKVIALVGGSHSAHWLPALQVLAEHYDWQIVTFLKSACSFGTAGKKPSCIQWNRDVSEATIKLRPDVVFTTSTRYRYIDSERPNGVRRREVVPDEYLAQWSLLSEAGVSIVAVRDNPEMKVSAPECIELNWPDIMKCARPRTDRIDTVDPTTILAPKPTNVAFIDLTDRFCDSTWCPPVGGNIIIYRDKSHITASYARTLATVLEERMRKVRPDLFVDAPGAERSQRRVVAEPNG